jgi:hypothetical protein
MPGARNGSRSSSGATTGRRSSSPAPPRTTAVLPQFDAVVLLSAPAEVLLPRLESRTRNDYGKTREERDLILKHLADVEPLLRATCTHEIDASEPLELVVEQLAAIAAGD